MLIVGELINTSRSSVHEAVQSRDAAYIQQLAVQQAEAGAKYIDLNCGTFGRNEADSMIWLVETVQEKVTIPLSIDSCNPEVITAGLKACRTPQPMINSVNAQKGRYAALVEEAQKYKAKVVALCTDKLGEYKTPQQRTKVAGTLIEELTELGIPEDDIYLDPLVYPICTGESAVTDVLETAAAIRTQFPGAHIITSISNVSYGFPNRRVLNRAFLVQSMTVGADAFILDPLDCSLMGLVCASKALLGKDALCMDYLFSAKNGALKVK